MDTTYTPIVLCFQPAVLDTDDTALVHVHPALELWLQITPPPTLGVLPHTSYVKVPSSGCVHLKLRPSWTPTRRHPVHRYHVGYAWAEPGARPFYTESWVVPPPPTPQTAWVTHTGGPDRIPIRPGLGLYQVLSVSHPGTYQVRGDWLEWVDNPPAPGATYTVVYQEGITREHLRELS